MARSRWWRCVVGMVGCGIVAGAAAVACAAGGFWRGTCAKCGHQWIRYVQPDDAYSVCSFRGEGRGWCEGRIIWDREPTKK